MSHSRDILMEAADGLARRLRYNYRGRENWVSHNELQKVQRYLMKHSRDPNPWAGLLRLLSQGVPRSGRDWNCMKEVLGEYRASEFPIEELSLILGWAARLLRYYAK